MVIEWAGCSSVLGHERMGLDLDLVGRIGLDFELRFFNDGWDGMASGTDLTSWELNGRDVALYLATGGWGWIWIWYLAAEGWGWICSTMGGMGLAIVIVG